MSNKKVIIIANIFHLCKNIVNKKGIVYTVFAFEMIMTHNRIINKQRTLVHTSNWTSDSYQDAFTI